MAIRTREGGPEVKLLKVEYGQAIFEQGQVVVSGCPLVDLVADGGQEEIDAAVKAVQGRIVLSRTGEEVVLVRINLETGEIDATGEDGRSMKVVKTDLWATKGLDALREAIHSLPWF